MNQEVYDQDGKLLKKGDAIIDFRGDMHIFQSVVMRPEPGKSGKVHTNKGIYFWTVFKLKETK